MTEEGRATPSPVVRGTSYGFIGFLIALITLALITGYAVFIGGTQFARQQLGSLFDTRKEVSLIEIIIDGKARLMRPEAVVSLVPGLSARLEERMPAVIAETNQFLETRVDAAFAPALDRIPAFTDWYYSLRGEYSRYLEALTSDLPGFMARRLTEEVIDPSGLEETLDELQDALNNELGARIRAETDWALGTLSGLVDSLSVPRETPEYRGTIGHSVELGPALRDSLAFSEQELGQKALTALAATGTGTLVAKGLGTVVVKQLVAKVMGTSGMKLAVSLLAKLVMKVGVKGGGSAAAGAAGLTVCAPGGLLAIGCGIVAAGVVWLLVDKAFIEIEEALDRDAFEADLRTAILTEREALKQRLRTAYEDAIRQQYAEFAKQLLSQDPAPLRPLIEGAFVPSQSGRGARTIDE